MATAMWHGNSQSHNWCWLGTTLQCLSLASGGQEAFHDECPDDVAVWATLWVDMLAGTTGAVYHPHAIARLFAEEGQPTVTPCHCSGRCQCVRKAPNFEWMQQSEMAQCWKHMVPKLVGAGVCSLSNCLSHEQWWQRCPVCDKKVLQAGREMAMAAQVLRVTNQGQRLRMRIREGMRGRLLDRPTNAPPMWLWGRSPRGPYTSVTGVQQVGSTPCPQSTASQLDCGS